MNGKEIEVICKINKKVIERKRKIVNFFKKVFTKQKSKYIEQKSNSEFKKTK